MIENYRCGKCGRRVGIYLDEVSGRYLAHRFPFAFHRATLFRPERDVRAEVDAAYAATHARLAADPEYQRLRAAAGDEERSTPRMYFMRNRLAIYVETQMPPIVRITHG